MSKFTEEDYFEELFEMREDAVEDWSDMKPSESLSLIPEIIFAMSVIGVPSELYAKYDSVLEEYDGKEEGTFSDDEVLVLNKIADVFIKKNDDDFIKLVLDTLIFNCQCVLESMRIIMMKLAEHLDIKFESEC